METTRHIGIDLHRNKFTCCMQLANGRNYLSEWKVENLPVFCEEAAAYRRGGRGGNR